MPSLLLCSMCMQCMPASGLRNQPQVRPYCLLWSLCSLPHSRLASKRSSCTSHGKNPMDQPLPPQISSAKNLFKDIVDEADKTSDKKEEQLITDEKMEESTTPTVLSEKRKALFEPLEPIMDLNGRRPSAETLLPPPDFDSASYPRGWLIGKKRKLVNVDVVESMRRIAVQEMNRKDREIDGLNEQLEEDARVLEHLQLQLLDERSKRADAERQKSMLQNQVDMLMNMLQEPENIDDEDATSQEP